MKIISPTTNDVATALQAISAEVAGAVHSVNPEAVTHAAELILAAPRVYFEGAGRSGIALKMNAMRFMHLGLHAFVIGETTAPGVGENDVVILASGSGNTASVVSVAQKVKAAGAKILLLTAGSGGELSNLADVTVNIAAAGKQSVDRSSSAQYAGSLFEQAVVLVLDAVFHAIWVANNIPAETLWVRHANWE